VFPSSHYNIHILESMEIYAEVLRRNRLCFGRDSKWVSAECSGRCSAVDRVDGPKLEGVKEFSFLQKPSRPTMGLIQSTPVGIGALRGVKRAGRDADKPHPSSAEIRIQ
jgi:hypothetical protein